MIPLYVPEIRGNEWRYVKECFDTNWVSSVGSYVDRFEKEFAKYLKVENAVVTMNGTAALELALRTLNIGPGDEVIVSSMTFISPVNAIKYVGAEPVFVDICEDTWVIDADRIEELITPKTKAILPIHIYGQIANMDEIMEIATRHGLYVVEDATESLGSIYNGKFSGTLGHIGCYSFNGNKIITTGSGGMLVTNDKMIAQRAKYLSTQTKTVLENGAFYHDEIGFNYRMPNVLAAIGCAQLENIEEFLSLKIETAKLYSEYLGGVRGITLPQKRENVRNNYWLYSILIDDEYPLKRDELIVELKKNGVITRPFFMPVHEMPPYINAKHGNMDNTKKVSMNGMNLPSSVNISKEEVEYICSIIKSFCS